MVRSTLTLKGTKPTLVSIHDPTQQVGTIRAVQERTSVDQQELPNGSYFLEWKSGNGTINMLRMMVIH